MIRGRVTPDHDVVVRLDVLGPDSISRAVDAVIDTGFSGFLSLAPALIADLKLPFRQTETYTLADEIDIELDVYRGSVGWEGRMRPVFVVAAHGDALVGMSLIRGHRLTIDALDGGAVTIEPLPS